MTEPTQNSRVSGGKKENFARSKDSDLFAILVDRPLEERQQSTASQTVPQDVASLIETANRLRSINLPPAQTAFRVVLRGKLLTHMANTPVPVSAWDNFLNTISSQMRVMSGRTLRLAAAAVTVLAIALTSTGTAYAAQSALPGDLLYGVKTGMESLQLAITPAEDDAELHLAFADRRLAEIEALAAQNRFDDIAIATQALTDQLGLATGDVDPEDVREHSSNAVNALLAVYERVPAQARQAIEAALLKIAERQGIEVELPEVNETPVTPNSNKPGEKPNQKPNNQPNENAQKTNVPPGLEKKTNEPPGVLKKTPEPKAP